jgi:hypothetical protein
MPSSGMLRGVVLVRSDFSEERSATVNRVRRLGRLRTTLAVTSNRRSPRRCTIFICSVRRLLVTANIVPSLTILVTLMMKAIHFSRRRYLHGPHGVISQKTAILNGKYLSSFAMIQGTGTHKLWKCRVRNSPQRRVASCPRVHTPCPSRVMLRVPRVHTPC